MYCYLDAARLHTSSGGGVPIGQTNQISNIPSTVLNGKIERKKTLEPLDGLSEHMEQYSAKHLQVSELFLIPVTE